MFARVFGLLTVALIALFLLCGQPIGRAADSRKADPPIATAKTKSLEQLIKESRMSYKVSPGEGDRPPVFEFVIRFSDVNDSVLVTAREIISQKKYPDGEPVALFSFVGVAQSFEEGQKLPDAALVQKLNELNNQFMMGGFCYNQTGVYHPVGAFGRGMDGSVLRETIVTIAADSYQCRKAITPVLKGAGEGQGTLKP